MAPVEFQLLGPFEVIVDGERRPLGSPGEKAVLALLLLAAGRVVSKDALVDALWGEALPANPANAVQGRISRLRRALDEIGVPGSLVVARGPGYVAQVERDQVDVHRFASLIRQARAEGGNARTAGRLYGEALALWRGPALADFAAESWAAPEVTQLEELRLAALEERMDLELQSGRHLELVDELEALASANPLRERLHGQLMLALYRSGRQADALAAYRRASEAVDLIEHVTAAERLLQKERVVQVVHGDFWDNNVLFDEEAIAAALDFGFMNQRPRVDDLALSFWFYLLEPGHGRPAAADQKVLGMLVDAYNEASAMPLTAAELEALPLATARQPAWSF